MEGAARPRWRVSQQTGTQVAIGAVIGLLLVLPLGAMLLRAVVEDGQVTFGPAWAFLSAARTWRVLGSTLSVVLPATCLAVLAGFALAWLISRTDVPFKTTLQWLPLLPILIPKVMATIGWVFLLSPTGGYVNQLIRAVTGGEGRGPIDVFSVPAMILVMGLSLVPFMYALAYPALIQMNGEMEEASLVSGRGELETVFRVTIPAITPALFNGTLLTLMVAFAQFSIPLILGTPMRFEVLTTFLFWSMTRYPADFTTAALVGLLLAVISLSLFSIANRLMRSASYVLVSGKGTARRQIRLGRARYLVTALLVVYLLLAVGLPVMALLLVSLTPFWGAPLEPGMLSLRWYSELFATNPWAAPAIWNSLLLAGSGSLLCIVLGFSVAWFKHRRPSTIANVLMYLGNLPLGLPSSLLGAGALLIFTTLLSSAYGTLVPILAVYVTLYLPFALRAISAALAQIGPELEEAAEVSGRSSLGAVTAVTLPIARRGIFFGWLLVFVLLAHELEAAIFLVTPGTRVISSALLDMWQSAAWPAAAAYSVVVIGSLGAFVLGIGAVLGMAGTRR